MTSQCRYRLNEPDVTFESFEGEILLIHLGNGNYFSLRGIAPAIWPALLAGHPLSQIVLATQECYSRPVASLGNDIESFVISLVESELIVERDDAPSSNMEPIQAPANYEAPTFEQFDDMQDLLLLDPIHEVDVTGWPQRPADQKEPSA